MLWIFGCGFCWIGGCCSDLFVGGYLGLDFAPCSVFEGVAAAGAFVAGVSMCILVVA